LDLGDRSSRFIDEHEWQGTRDPAAYLSVPAAIQFQAEHDWLHVRQKCHELVRHARQVITELTRLEPICPDSLEWYAQMATIPLPPCEAEELKRRLYDEYRIEVPVISWNDPSLSAVSSRNSQKGAPSGRSHLPDCDHKWMMAPKGAGCLYARREVQHLLTPLVINWGWESEENTLISLDSTGKLASPCSGARVAGDARRFGVFGGAGGDRVHGSARLGECAGALSRVVERTARCAPPEADLPGLDGVVPADGDVRAAGVQCGRAEAAPV